MIPESEDTFSMSSSHVALDQSMSRSTTSARSLAPGCCCPPRSRSGWDRAGRRPAGRCRGRGRAARPGRKLLTLVHAMVAGGDCIDDVKMLRCGATQAVLGHRVMAASTVGTWLRAFTLGDVRQLDRVCGEILGRSGQRVPGPGSDHLTVRKAVLSACDDPGFTDIVELPQAFTA
jgi:hypothetical protein